MYEYSSRLKSVGGLYSQLNQLVRACSVLKELDGNDPFPLQRVHVHVPSRNFQKYEIPAGVGIVPQVY